MKSCITISLVDEARGGPFVFSDGLQDGCQRAAALGFDAVEVFPPGADAVDAASLRQLLTTHSLQLAAVGTGAGWVKHRLSLTDADASRRQAAANFVESIIDFAGQFGASAIIGSMQGRTTSEVNHTMALDYLKEAFDYLGPLAARHGVPLFYEPLNRYETDLCNTLADGCRLLESLTSENVLLLADLFHMNIEETNLADALQRTGAMLGHVHFVDSNRRAVGMGHLDMANVMQGLRTVGYEGYLSAEALPLPSSTEAAESTMQAFRHWTAASQ